MRATHRLVMRSCLDRIGRRTRQSRQKFCPLSWPVAVSCSTTSLSWLSDCDLGTKPGSSVAVRKRLYALRMSDSAKKKFVYA